MTDSTTLWVFATFQIVMDLYLVGLVIYWIVQRRRYGTFNPLSPFQHRDLQTARSLLSEFKNISHQTAVLLHQLKTEQEKCLRTESEFPPVTTISKATVAPVVELPKPAPIVAKTTPQTTAEAPHRPVVLGFHPPNGLVHRTQQVQNLLRQGMTPIEIRRMTGASQEEINLIKAIR